MGYCGRLGKASTRHFAGRNQAGICNHWRNCKYWQNSLWNTRNQKRLYLFSPYRTKAFRCTEIDVGRSTRQWRRRLFHPLCPTENQRTGNRDIGLAYCKNHWRKTGQKPTCFPGNAWKNRRVASCENDPMVYEGRDWQETNLPLRPSLFRPLFS